VIEDHPTFSAPVTPAQPGARAKGPALALLALAFVFVALGVWQLYRLNWKLHLIAQTQAAVHAAPIDPAALPRGDIAPLTYHRLAMTGFYAVQATTLVTGTSGLGTGYWEMVPLVGYDGRTVMINRGFLPEGSKLDPARAAVPTGPVHVEGLLRPTEPHAFLRSNQPAQDRWYSRDVAAIAARHGVTVDPRLFIDSWTETPRQADAPTPGLTVIEFPNNHLGYALTWFTMAIMAIAGGIVLLRRR
jgi:surfeit locus 1 family protein